MRFLTTVLFVFFIFQVQAGAQTAQERVRVLGDSAVALMDRGQADEAILLLRQAEKLDPSAFAIPYEIAIAQYQKKDYKEAELTMKRVMKFKDANDQAYMLLGNIQDDMGDRKKALATYAEGLKKFPNSGKLHLETGNIHASQGNYDEAMEWYEEGIQREPSFPSNYYHAARLFSGSTEKVWTMMYGEIFINLERNSARTVEISKLLYDTYQGALVWNGDTSLSITFSMQNTITTADTFKDGKPRLPFGVGVYEMVLGAAAGMTGTQSLEKICKMREAALDIYYERDFWKGRPVNAVFDYQKRVANAGHLNAYNHWLLSQGSPARYTKWRDANKDELEKFLEWFRTNGLKMSERNRLVRSDA